MHVRMEDFGGVTSGWKQCTDQFNISCGIDVAFSCHGKAPYGTCLGCLVCWKVRGCQHFLRCRLPHKLSNPHTMLEMAYGCRFAPYGLPPICPSRDQDWFLNYFVEEVDRGSFYAKGLLELTPCDLWPYIRGKTIWLIGDSIMQVQAPALSAPHKPSS